MLGLIIVLFLVLPFIDIYLLIELSNRIGIVETVGIVLFTGIVGAAVVRREGRGLLRKIGSSVTAREISRNILEGLLLALGGLLLVSPGLVTDFLGLLFVLRPSRERIMVRLAKKLEDSTAFRFEVQRF